MPGRNPASAEPATPTRTPHPGLQELAEGCLRRNPYLALKNVSCDGRGGVLVLRGCLPTYYLKQVAQEVVARLEGVEMIDNQIQVVTPAYPSRQG
jgi:osmotically-inducible protein OsmY